MIFADINMDTSSFHYSAAIERGLNFLRTHDLTQLAPGKHQIEGDDIYANVDDVTTKDFEACKLEAHRNYIDIQYLVSGEERLGFSLLKSNYELAEAYEERDLYFYKEVENEGFIESRAGNYCIFYPTDIHRPLIKTGDTVASLRKVVVKVKVALL